VQGVGVGDSPGLIEGEGGRSPELGRGKGNIAPLGRDGGEGEGHGGIGETAVVVGRSIDGRLVWSERGAEEEEDVGDDFVGEDDGGRGDGVESALEEDAVGSETVDFMVDAGDLGMDKESLVGGRLEDTVGLDSVEGTAAALTNGHVFWRKEGRRECAGGRRLHWRETREGSGG